MVLGLREPGHVSVRGLLPADESGPGLLSPLWALNASDTHPLSSLPRVPRCGLEKLGSDLARLLNQALFVSERSVQLYRWPASRLARCTHVLKINPSFHLILTKGSSMASWPCPADLPVVQTHCKGTTLMERWEGWFNYQGCLFLGKCHFQGHFSTTRHSENAPSHW